MPPRPPRFRRWRWTFLITLGLAGFFVAAANFWILRRARARVYPSPAAIPAEEVAIVLGTSPHLRHGAENPFFEGRLDAAAELYHAGKAHHFLLSGDNSRVTYDEPTAMRAGLAARGVPESATTLDYAGFRTLDTMARAVHVFGLRRAVIITDDFHEARSLFLARSFGLEAIGYASHPVPLRFSRKTRLREIASRTVAWLDVYILRTRPKFYGPKETTAGA